MKLRKTEQITYDILLKNYKKNEIIRGKAREPDFILPDKYVEVKTTNYSTLYFTELQLDSFQKYKNLEIWIFINNELIAKRDYKKIRYTSRKQKEIIFTKQRTKERNQKRINKMLKNMNLGRKTKWKQLK